MLYSSRRAVIAGLACAIAEAPFVAKASSSVYPTKSSVEAATIGSAVGRLELDAFATPGDGGGARYKRVASEPNHAGKIQSADGLWWEIDEPLVDPRMLGAIGDGAVDDTPPLQAAVDTAIALGVPIVVPRRRFRLRSTVTIPRGIEIIGRGWEPYTGRTDKGEAGSINPVGLGSYFYCSDPGFNIFSITAKSGVTFRDVAFDWDHPLPSTTTGTSWKPQADYGWAIYTDCCEYTRIFNVLMRNVVKGVRLDTGAEKLWVNGLFGQCLGTMIDIDFASDIVRIENVHDWRFWSLNSNVRSYQLQNSDVIVSGRNDNPFFSNIFGIGCRSLFRFKKSSTAKRGKVTNKAHLQNIDADILRTGLLIDADAPNVTAQITNWTGQGSADIPGSRQIEIFGQNARIYAVNFRSSFTHAEAVYVGGANSFVALENAEFQAWGLDGVSPSIRLDAANVTVALGTNIAWRQAKGSGPRVVWVPGTSFQYRGSVVARATKKLEQTVTDGAAVKVSFSVADLNGLGSYDMITDRMRPPLPGHYRITAGVEIGGGRTGAYELLEISRNGLPVKQTFPNMRDGRHTVEVSTIVFMDGETDYIELKYQQNSGRDQTISPANTILQLERID